MSAPKKLLVVDDEGAVREILAEALEAFGFETICAESADRALEILDEQVVDLVLSDIEMPGLSGIELLDKIKVAHEDLDVVMVTGVIDAQIAVDAIRRGATDYVTKPFNLDEVQIVIDRTLEKRRLIRENSRYQLHLEDLVAVRTNELLDKTKEVEALYQSLEESYESTLQSLVTALDFRDNETHGHSLRVVEYAVVVAEQLGVDEETMAWIRRGAILHDVGKIGIPDSILNKPGKLTEEEWDKMKEHPELGYRMLEHIRFLRPALDIVISHQERFDGTGYPHGKKGEEIPLGARIFAVVDTFDAMTSDRPYRSALSIDEARAEIERWSGRQFDPKVAEAFLRIDAETWLGIRTRVHREVLALESQVRKAFS